MTKLEKLKDILSDMGSVLVAYSGGVDSTFLLKISLDVLGDKAVAVMATSEVYPTGECSAAEKIAADMGARFILIETEELRNPNFICNSPDRCYHCKIELFGELNKIAEREGLAYVAHGANVDDLGDYRPGTKAAKELGTRAPLQEAGLTKAEIRELSKELGLPTWDKPSLACLASRFPYGTSITQEALIMIDQAETLLRSLGFGQVRVRHHGDIARIEIEADEIPALLDTEVRERVIAGFKELGYLYVTLDLEGYRTGSMNAVLDDK